MPLRNDIVTIGNYTARIKNYYPSNGVVVLFSQSFLIIYGKLFSYYKTDSMASEDPPAITIQNSTWRSATIVIQGK